MARWVKSADGGPAIPEPKRGRRHPLLVYAQLNEQVFWPAVFILAITGGLAVWNPPQMAPYRPYLAIVLAGTGLILVLTFAFRMQAYVQCRPDGLYVQTPLQRLSIPYRDIRTTRPNLFYHLFPPDTVRWTQRSYLEPLMGRTAVIVEMEKLPQPARWLRLRMGKYLLSPDVTGLALVVRDWMGLRSELDEFSSWDRQVSHAA